MAERIRYEIKGRKGIDDLLSLYAFSGNSQGDTSVSNNIQNFLDSEGWMNYNFDVEMTDEAIAKEIERRIELNKEYLTKLEKERLFGEEYTQILELEYNPALDERQIVPNGPLESYRATFLDFSEEDDV